MAPRGYVTSLADWRFNAKFVSVYVKSKQRGQSWQVIVYSFGKYRLRKDHFPHLSAARGVQKASALWFCCVTRDGSASWVSGQCDDSLQVLSLLKRAESVVTPCKPPSIYLTHSCQPAPDGFAPFENAERKPIPAFGEKEPAGKEA